MWHIFAQNTQYLSIIAQVSRMHTKSHFLGCFSRDMKLFATMLAYVIIMSFICTVNLKIINQLTKFLTMAKKNTPSKKDTKKEILSVHQQITNVVEIYTKDLKKHQEKEQEYYPPAHQQVCEALIKEGFPTGLINADLTKRIIENIGIPSNPIEEDQDDINNPN